MERTLPRWFRTTLFLLVILGIVYFLIQVSALVKVVLIAAVIAYVLDPFATYLESKSLSRTAATIIIFVLIILVFIGGILLIFPVLVNEIEAIAEGVTMENASVYIKNFEKFIRERLSFFGLEDIDLMITIQTTMIDIADRLLNFLPGIFSVVINIAIIPVTVLFLLRDGRKIKKKLLEYIPNRYFEFSLNLVYKIDLQLGNYIRGILTEAFIVGVLSITALWLLDIRYYVLIGAFAGIANMIPYLGPIAGAIPGILVGIFETGDLMTGVYVALAFGCVQLIDNVVVQPLVLSHSVRIHPLAILLGIVVGGKLFGILGMLFAVPVLSIIKIIFQEGMQIYNRYQFR